MFMDSNSFWRMVLFCLSVQVLGILGGTTDNSIICHDCKKLYMYGGGLQNLATLYFVGRKVSFMCIVTIQYIYSISLPRWRCLNSKNELGANPVDHHCSFIERNVVNITNTMVCVMWHCMNGNAIHTLYTHFSSWSLGWYSPPMTRKR